MGVQLGSEWVSTMPRILHIGKEQEVLHPAHQIGLVLFEGQLLLSQEVRVRFEYLLKLLAIAAHIESPELYPGYHYTGMPA
jgi:hypothetical protein